MDQQRVNELEAVFRAAMRKRDELFELLHMANLECSIACVAWDEACKELDLTGDNQHQQDKQNEP
jgi:hypothetical protein